MFYKTKLAIITGGSSGLGLDLARQLAKRQTDWTIVIASRQPPNKPKTLPSNIVHHRLDCSSLQDVRRFAAEITSTYANARIHALVLNAGVQIVQGAQKSVDGMDLTFATNHVGQALLFFLLLNQLSPACRIMLTSSGTHDPSQGTNYPKPDYQSAEQCAAPVVDGKTTMKDGQHRYSRSKMVNIMWALLLRKHIKQAQLQYPVAAFDPGFMPGTQLARGFPGPIRFVWLHLLPHLLPLLRVVMLKNTHTTAASASNYIKLILDAKLHDDEDVKDVYWDYSGALPANPDAYKEDKLTDLWQWTLDKVAKDGEERARFAALKGE